MNCFETLTARMEGAVAIDAWLLGLGSEGALLAERLAARLPTLLPSEEGRRHAALDLYALAQGALRTLPTTAASALLSEEAPVVLIDAVLWRGETVARAVSLLRQHGVRAPIELAVLADRGGRLVPVAPTYSGGEIVVAEDTVLQLLADGEKLRFNEMRVSV
jgi:pyrimidine operon attenuation protein/uracil phosphoribosyltransferase